MMVQKIEKNEKMKISKKIHISKAKSTGFKQTTPAFRLLFAQDTL